MYVFFYFKFFNFPFTHIFLFRNHRFICVSRSTLLCSVRTLLCLGLSPPRRPAQESPDVPTLWCTWWTLKFRVGSKSGLGRTINADRWRLRIMTFPSNRRDPFLAGGAGRSRRAVKQGPRGGQSKQGTRTAGFRCWYVGLRGRAPL